MSFGKVILMIILFLLLGILILIPILKFIAHVSNFSEIKNDAGKKEAYKYVGFVLLQGILAVL